MVFSFVYIYDGHNSGPNGPRLMVFIHTDLNDTTGGDSERFRKKAARIRQRGVMPAAPILVGAGGKRQGGTWTLETSGEWSQGLGHLDRALLAQVARRLETKREHAPALPNKLGQETNTVKSERKTIPK